MRLTSTLAVGLVALALAPAAWATPQQGATTGNPAPSSNSTTRMSDIAKQTGIQQSTVTTKPTASPQDTSRTTPVASDDDEGASPLGSPSEGPGNSASSGTTSNASLAKKAISKLLGLPLQPVKPATDPNIVTLQALQVKVQTVQAQPQLDSPQQKMLKDLSVLLDSAVHDSSSGTVNRMQMRQIQAALKGLRDAGVKGLPDPNTFAGPDDATAGSGTMTALASYDNPTDPEDAGVNAGGGASIGGAADGGEDSGEGSSSAAVGENGYGSVAFQSIYGTTQVTYGKGWSNTVSIPSTQVAGPSSVLNSPDTHPAGPSSGGLTGPSSAMTGPSSGGLTGPSSAMTGPSSGGLTGPSSALTGPSSAGLTGPSSVMTGPSSGGLTTPSGALGNPEARADADADDQPSLCGR